jgi:hypothetical protein
MVVSVELMVSIKFHTEFSPSGFKLLGAVRPVRHTRFDGSNGSHCEDGTPLYCCWEALTAILVPPGANMDTCGPYMYASNTCGPHVVTPCHKGAAYLCGTFVLCKAPTF